MQEKIIYGTFFEQWGKVNISKGNKGGLNFKKKSYIELQSIVRAAISLIEHQPRVSQKLARAQNRVFSCPENRDSAPILGQMAKMPRFGSDFYNMWWQNRSTIKK